MSNVHVLAGKYSPLGYQQITDVSGSTGLTVPAGSRLALVSCENQNVRWRDDGTAPTSTVGMLLSSGSELSYSANLERINFIEIAGGAELNISYYA